MDKRRNRSKQAALSFLTNITLGNENESKELHIASANVCASPESLISFSLTSDQLHASTSSHSLTHRELVHYRTSSSDSSTTEVHLTREDSERPIASEKLRKKSDANSETNSKSFMSVFQYYIGRGPKANHKSHRQEPYINSYFHQHVMNINLKHRKAISYAHFVNQEEDDFIAPYNPDYIENATEPASFFQSAQVTKLYYFSNKSAKELSNEKFRMLHPEINITLSKIRTIKSRMLTIGKSLDLEISSISHSYAYLEKLILKQIVTKQNRKLIAACCLFLAAKVNEPKGLDYQLLFDNIYSVLYVSSKDIKNHEFAIFADLQFNLYLPPCEFMPHFDRIAQELEIQSIDAYLGYADFYKTMDN